MKALFKKYREIIMYLIFGVLTTAVGFGTYFLIMAGAEHLLSIPLDNETSFSRYAQISSVFFLTSPTLTAGTAQAIRM